MIKLIKKFKKTDTPTDKYITFYDFHSIRYTFVLDFFDYYEACDDEFKSKILSLSPIAIWNIYKNLSVDVQEKT